MTVDSLFDECWADLPFMRKHLAGREATYNVFIDALREWDTPALAACRTHYEQELYGQALLSRVQERTGKRYGFAILTIILIAVASAVISWLVSRWLDHLFPKDAFEAMRVGL